MKFTVDELEQLFKLSIECIRNHGIEEIKFLAEDDLYFKIWHNKRQFTSEFMEKPEYTLGSLSDDINELRRVLYPKDEDDILVSYDLERIGAILTALGSTFYKRLKEEGYK